MFRQYSIAFPVQCTSTTLLP